MASRYPADVFARRKQLDASYPKSRIERDLNAIARYSFCARSPELLRDCHGSRFSTSTVPRYCNCSDWDCQIATTETSVQIENFVTKVFIQVLNGPIELTREFAPNGSNWGCGPVSYILPNGINVFCLCLSPPNFHVGVRGRFIAHRAKIAVLRTKTPEILSLLIMEVHTKLTFKTIAKATLCAVNCSALKPRNISGVSLTTHQNRLMNFNLYGLNFRV
jgi:hypothetical protein